MLSKLFMSRKKKKRRSRSLQCLSLSINPPYLPLDATSYLEIDHNGLVAKLVHAIHDPLAPHDDNLSANVELVLQHLTNLVLKTIWAFMDPMGINSNAIEDQVVLPSPVDVIETILTMKDVGKSELDC